MGWLIRCTESGCKETRWAENIVDLIENHRDQEGWFLCGCGKHGCIEKNFALQEPGETWQPFLRGVIPLGEPGHVYQPFVFLCSYELGGEVADVWFSYYK